jgi:pimeloyl-ACP methyl ester carboxylesterase
MLMDELGVDQAAIAGHSMGGQIALYLAAMYPDRASQLILSAPAGFERFTDQDQMAFRATVSPAGIAATPEPMIRQNAAATFYSFPDDAEFMIEDRIAMTSEPGFENYAEAQAQSIFAMLETPVWEMMPEIEQPTLVVFGAQDALIPNRFLHPDLTVEAVAEQGTERLPNATLKLINDAGHFVHFEQAGEFNSAVLEFLNQN